MRRCKVIWGETLARHHPETIGPRIPQYVRGLLAATCIAIVGSSQTAAQSPPPRMSFEVASVRPNLAEPNPFRGEGVPRQRPGGRFEALNVSLRTLIRYAYGLQPYQKLEGAPRQLDERFDVHAKAAGEAEAAGDFNVGPMNLMVQMTCPLHPIRG